MKKYILLLFVFIGFVSQAQTWEEKVKNDPAYIKYKEEALAFYCSEAYFKEVYLSSLFSEKMGKSIQKYNSKNFKKWIDENLDKTTFASKEEGLKVFSERSELIRKNRTESSQIKIQFDEIGKKYGYDEFLKFEGDEVQSVAIKKYIIYKQNQKTFN